MVKNDSGEKRARNGTNTSEKAKQNMRTTNSFRQKELTVKRKLSSSSKSLNKNKNPKIIFEQAEPER